MIAEKLYRKRKAQFWPIDSKWEQLNGISTDLPCPKSECMENYMELDGFANGQRVFFSKKGGSEGGFTIVIEFLIGEASEYGCFADSTVANRDEFDLVN